MTRAYINMGISYFFGSALISLKSLFSIKNTQASAISSDYKNSRIGLPLPKISIEALFSS